MLNQLVLRLLTWFQREEGQDMIEYALIVSVLSVVIVVAAVGLIDPAIKDWATDVASKINIA
jgi:Flp pilus assembly pilin Flp